MAIYVGIRKKQENANSALYEYGPDEVRVGQMRINKQTGEVDVLQEVPGDEKRAYSPCAKRKLTKHWQDNEFPDVTYWAS